MKHQESLNMIVYINRIDIKKHICVLLNLFIYYIIEFKYLYRQDHNLDVHEYLQLVK